ncbi:MAG: helicase-related protein [Candidatus Hodarchaeota archaeon]
MSPINRVIQKREYQESILRRLKENFHHSPRRHTIAEVDTGLGKRVLTYLLIKEVLQDQKILLLLHSTSSYAETMHYFKQEYGGFENEQIFQGISSRTPTWLREKILKNKEARIIATTPQTFANTFKRIKPPPKFDVLIVNEIDKIVRRQGDERLLIYPYNTLIPHFISQGTWIIGMTGTLRDSHVFYNSKKDKIEVQHELISLDKRIPNLYVIRMDTLIENTDIMDYIEDSISYIQMYPVEANPELQQVLEMIDQAINEIRTNILEETKEKNPSLIEAIPSNQLALVSSMLKSDSGEVERYQGLLLIRKYCTAMQTKKYRRFLYRLKKYGITKDLIRSLPDQNAKTEAIIEIIQKQPRNSKFVVLCSFLDSANEITVSIQASGIKSFLITGQVKNKGIILKEFKKYKGEAALVMTSVGERDIDLPQANLLIVYDSINTTKTMYQRMKRTRGGLVLCLYYKNTFEERKVSRLLRDISKRYPWSSVIE